MALAPLSPVLLHPTVLLAAEEVDDVDRTDFSDPALSEDKKTTTHHGPHSEVEAASLLPDIIEEGSTFAPTRAQLCPPTSAAPFTGSARLADCEKGLPHAVAG